MMDSLPLWIVPALLLFWVVGAYQRLARLRRAVAAAFAALDAQLVRQLVWVEGILPPALRDMSPTAAVPQERNAVRAVWWGLKAANTQLGQALALARGQLFEPPALAALTAARSDLNRAWQAVRASGRGMDGAPLSEAWSVQQEHLLAQTLPLCESFNQAVFVYNEAIALFPAVLLARLLGLRPVAALQPMALVA